MHIYSDLGHTKETNPPKIQKRTAVLMLEMYQSNMQLASQSELTLHQFGH